MGVCRRILLGNAVSNQRPTQEISNDEAPKGSLVVVGSGIAIGQITPQAECQIREADVVMAVVCEGSTARRIFSWSKEHVDLLDCYIEDRARGDIYAEQADLVLEQVRAGRRVCLVYYGHPGVLCNVSAATMRTARAEGYPVQMFPAISAESCLYADLEIDPGLHGMQSYASQIFLEHDKQWDPTTPLILWQIGFVADPEHSRDYPNRRLPDIIVKLTAVYGDDHEVIIYEATTLPFLPFRADRVTLENLASTPLSPASTLFVPPKAT